MAVARAEINIPQIHSLTKGLCFTPPDVGCYLCQFASLRVLSSRSGRTTSSNQPTDQPTNNQMLCAAARRRRRCRIPHLIAIPARDRTTDQPTNTPSLAYELNQHTTTAQRYMIWLLMFKFYIFGSVN